MKKVLAVVGSPQQFLSFEMTEKRLLECGGAPPYKSVLVQAFDESDSGWNGRPAEEHGPGRPDYRLSVGNGPASDETGRLMPLLREIVDRENPAAVVVYGDTPLALAGALVAAHAGLPLAHVGSGERRYRRRLNPAEANRVAIDHLADLNIATSRKAETNLKREGVNSDRIIFVGDPMFDAFLQDVEGISGRADARPFAGGLDGQDYGLAVLRPDESAASHDLVLGLLDTLNGAPLPIVLLANPRLSSLLKGRTARNLRVLDEPGYFGLLSLLKGCAFVVCDTSEVARLAYFAGKRCLVPPGAWWAADAVESGLATAVDVLDPQQMIQAMRRPSVEGNSSPRSRFGDGDAGEKIMAGLAKFIELPGVSESAWHRLGHIDDLPRPIDASAFFYDSYDGMIRSLHSAGYSFRGFDAIDDSEAGRFCLMRHDIDFDLEKAAEMAQVEAGLGISATYFLMLRTGHYNVFSIEGSQFCRGILDMGHRLGLHFDLAAYPDLDDATAIGAAVEHEASILEGWFGKPVEAVSFHRPNAFVLKGDPALTAPRPHSYSTELKKKAAYFADSGGAWKNGDPTSQEAFRCREPLHILVHPIWWAREPSSPLETLQSFVDRVTDQTMLSTARNCRPFRVGRFARMTYAD